VSIKPKLTQKMTMHLNGGNKFSELHFRVYADGKETQITRHKKTNGSPKYLITHDVFRCGDDEFDVMETKGAGMEIWLLSHVESAEGGEK